MSHRDDLDALVTELNAGIRPAAPGGEPGPARRADDVPELARLRGWLDEAVARSASDLLLVAGAPPSLRIDAVVHPLEAAFGATLGSEEIEDAVLPALPPHARRMYREDGIADGSYRDGDLGRFRINLHHERGHAAAAIRRLPSAVPRFASLHLPPPIEALTRLARGLVLVGGPTGSGKTTTLAALVNEINLREARHIITIEDPIEYEHPHRRSIVEQVEIGIDAPDFPTALRAALRQAPDVIVVGEMRDPETMQIALAAGETGHLVFSSLHTTDVATTVARIADSFPIERQNTVRQELAMALAAVLTQTLMPKVGGGLIPAAELLVVGYGARQHVRKNALQHLHQEVTITRRQGSFTLEESLTELVKQGLVDRKDAMTRAVHPEELERLLG
jgi:twitching motility protein PilT